MAQGKVRSAHRLTYTALGIVAAGAAVTWAALMIGMGLQ
jgi:hypothetical protein